MGQSREQHKRSQVQQRSCARAYFSASRKVHWESLFLRHMQEDRIRDRHSRLALRHMLLRFVQDLCQAMISMSENSGSAGVALYYLGNEQSIQLHQPRHELVRSSQC